MKLETGKAFNDFICALGKKLEAGEAKYGDVSFQTGIDATLEELAQEALDLAGWGFILYTKIIRLYKIT